MTPGGPTALHGPGRFRDAAELVGVVGVAVLVSWWCTEAGIPASWIFGFLVVFGLYSLLRDRTIAPPSSTLQPAQVLIAMVCTTPLLELDGATVRGYLLPTALSVLVMLLVSTVAGLVLARFGRTDPVSAMIATLAGGASAMTLMARELHLDVRFVVLTQYLRLTLVVLTLPVFVHLLGGGGGGSGGGDDWWEPDFRPVVGAVTVWAVTWVLVRLTRRTVTVPAPYLLVPIAVTWIFSGAGVSADWLTPHGAVLTTAYGIIGVQAGGTLTIGALRQLSHALPVILTAVTVMVAGTFGAALLIAHFTDISRLDAYLATVPGGIYAVLAFAHESGSSAVVTVGQVLRTLVMIVVGAYLPAIVRRLTGPRQGGADVG
ncbi:AbrB family transcriptional regulator [uncultured Corynebacterium sp.]|uniref:AbrB family transcriptional regulator n=1 Tax=uncultured Corynebacterium sp. TaxID=159447 RepID=UPI0025F5F59F|nr:AbrB family transcriptional regulator [uncultured Corynebacterium sp.]